MTMLIIGAGQAGLQTAEALRAEGYAGEIVLLGDEAHAPYHRPPLSKAYLLGDFAEAQLTIRAPDALARKGIALRSGIRVTAIDRAARQVSLADGSRLDYEGLALCTGSRARPLPVPGADLAGVETLRTLDDVRRIAATLPATQDVVVIGGGFIGLEFAAVASKLGKHVTVLEAAERLMARVVSPEVSEFYARLHRDHGVAVELGAGVTGIEGRDGRATAVTTADGRRFPAGLVVVGIGILPNTELAQAAGLTCERGIVVDACSRTSDPAIVAAGDCTARRLPDGSLRRLESVQNAVEQAKSAAAALMGKERPFAATPWFWSDQYDVKFQMAGLNTGYASTATRGNPAEGKFSLFYFDTAGRLLAIDSFNRPQDHMAGRKLLDKGASPTPAQAADEGFNLNGLLA